MVYGNKALVSSAFAAVAAIAGMAGRRAASRRENVGRGQWKSLAADGPVRI